MSIHSSRRGWIHGWRDVFLDIWSLTDCPHQRMPLIGLNYYIDRYDDMTRLSHSGYRQKQTST